MKFGTTIAILFFSGLVLMAIGNALNKRGSSVGRVMESMGKAIYLLWVGAVILVVAALIWLAFVMPK